MHNTKYFIYWNNSLPLYGYYFVIFCHSRGRCCINKLV